MRLAVAAGLSLALAAAPASAATFYVTTGLGTHETTVDAAHPATWNFFADTTNSHFAGAVFAMKHEDGTNFGIKMELIDNSAMILGTVTYADVTAYLAAGGSSEFDRFMFLLDSAGYALHDGGYYTLTLSLVGDGDGTGQSYVVRGLDENISLRATDDPDDIVVMEAANQPVATPEPASAVLLGAGLLGLGLRRRMRRGR